VVGLNSAVVLLTLSNVRSQVAVICREEKLFRFSMSNGLATMLSATCKSIIARKTIELYTIAAYLIGSNFQAMYTQEN